MTAVLLNGSGRGIPVNTLSSYAIDNIVCVATARFHRKQLSPFHGESDVIKSLTSATSSFMGHTGVSMEELGNDSLVRRDESSFK